MPDFGPYERRVNAYKKYAGDNWALLDCDCKELFVDVSSGDWKEWTKNDLKILATSKVAYDEYEFLVKLSVDLQKAAQNNDTKKYAYAYNALTALAPKTMPTAEAFYTAIITTYTENKAAIDATKIEHGKYAVDVTRKFLIKHGAEKLTKADLVAMNAVPLSIKNKPNEGDFAGLLDVSAVARMKDAKGQPTELALYAQAMLNELSADGKWETISNATADIFADEINKERAARASKMTEKKEQPKAPAKAKPVTKPNVKKAVAELDLQSLQIDAVAVSEVPAFYQQSALASLQRAGVLALDNTDELNAPTGSRSASLRDKQQRAA